jgi:hypothetical protein
MSHRVTKVSAYRITRSQAVVQEQHTGLSVIQALKVMRAEVFKVFR